MPISITNRVLQCKPDIGKREGYAVDFEANNYKNKLHHAVNTVSRNDSSYLSGCLYTHADNTREYLTTKLILTLANHKDSETPINPTSEALVLTYQNRGYVQFLND